MTLERAKNFILSLRIEEIEIEIINDLSSLSTHFNVTFFHINLIACCQNISLIIIIFQIKTHFHFILSLLIKWNFTFFLFFVIFEKFHFNSQSSRFFVIFVFRIVSKGRGFLFKMAITVNDKVSNLSFNSNLNIFLRIFEWEMGISWGETSETLKSLSVVCNFVGFWHDDF